MSDVDSFEYFSSLFVSLLLLVPVLLVLRVAPIRHVVISAAGLYLLALIAPRLAVFHLVFWTMVALVQPIVARTGERRIGLVTMWSALIVIGAPMVAWKIWPVDFQVRFSLWTNSAFRSTSEFLEALDFTAPIIGPIGLSFATFRAIDLLVKSNLGLIERLEPGRVIAYGCFAPVLIVGPISTYEESRQMIDTPVPLDRERVVRGVSEILSGLFKVFVVAWLLGWSPAVLVDFDVNPAWRIWVAMTAYTMFFYANFAGYSDMAIGAARLMGADLRPNFDSPYTKTHPAAFWNSWHMSLTRFLRSYVFTPIVGRHPGREYVGLMAVMIIIGLWHAVTWAALVYGLYHGTALILHRFAEQRRPPSESPVWRVVKPVFVYAWFGLALPLLELDLDRCEDLYRAMLGWR